MFQPLKRAGKYRKGKTNRWEIFKIGGRKKKVVEEGRTTHICEPGIGRLVLPEKSQENNENTLFKVGHLKRKPRGIKVTGKMEEKKGDDFDCDVGKGSGGQIVLEKPGRRTHSET